MPEESNDPLLKAKANILSTLNSMAARPAMYGNQPEGWMVHLIALYRMLDGQLPMGDRPLMKFTDRHHLGNTGIVQGILNRQMKGMPLVDQEHRAGVLIAEFCQEQGVPVVFEAPERKPRKIPSLPLSGSPWEVSGLRVRLDNVNVEITLDDNGGYAMWRAVSDPEPVGWSHDDPMSAMRSLSLVMASITQQINVKVDHVSYSWEEIEELETLLAEAREAYDDPYLITTTSRGPEWHVYSRGYQVACHNDEKEALQLAIAEAKEWKKAYKVPGSARTTGNEQDLLP